MVLINDNHSREIQQVYWNLYQNLARQKLLVANWQWGDDVDETQQKEDPEETQQKQQQSDKPLTSSSPHPQPNPNPPQISLDQKRESISQPHSSPSLLFQATQNEQLIDEIELTEGGIKSRKSTASSERLLAQIEILQSLPEGTIIPNAPSIRVQAIEKQGDKTVSSQTVLATDEQGRITKNVLSPSPQKTGTQVINEQLSLLKDPKVVKYLDNLIESRVNQKINQTVDPAFLEAQSQREQEPNNPKWWQQFIKKGGDFFKHWQQQYQQQQVAKKLYYLFTQKVQFGQSRYAQNGYTLVRQPIGQQDRYTVFNANNQPILTFDVGRQKRLSIIDAQLSIDDSKALLNLEKSKTNLTQNNQTLSLLMTRANNLAAQLVEMAQRQQQSIRRTGDSYTLAIDPNGDVEISANDGRGVIYHQTLQGNKPNATNLMTEADLTFFERQFPPSQQTSQTPVSTITENVAPTRRSRHR